MNLLQELALEQNLASFLAANVERYTKVGQIQILKNFISVILFDILR